MSKRHCGMQGTSGIPLCQELTGKRQGTTTILHAPSSTSHPLSQAIPSPRLSPAHPVSLKNLCTRCQPDLSQTPAAMCWEMQTEGGDEGVLLPTLHTQVLRDLLEILTFHLKQPLVPPLPTSPSCLQGMRAQGMLWTGGTGDAQPFLQLQRGFVLNCAPLSGSCQIQRASISRQNE